MKDEQISFSQSQMKIIDVYNWLVAGIMQYKIKIQRNTAWRENDKKELIDTIMNGYPIPSIFISNSILKEDEMKNIYHVLDGRQRLETIQEFIEGKFKYDNKKYSELSIDEKKKVLSYYIPIIMIDDSDLNQIKEIFRRLNKTAIRLNKIEITSSQYFEYSFMIFAKLAITTRNYDREIEEYIRDTQILYSYKGNTEKDEEVIEIYEEEITEDTNELNIENLKKELKNYSISLKNNEEVYKLFNNSKIFTMYEINRQVNLQHFLNIFVTIIEDKIAIVRSVDTSKKNWQEKIEVYSTEEDKIKEIVEKYERFKEVCHKVNNLFENLRMDSIFFNKSSLYTLLVYLYNNEKLTDDDLKIKIERYEENAQKREEYRKLVQERVNDKITREKRYSILEEIMENKE